MIADVLESATAKFWLLLFAVAFLFICFVLAVQVFAHIEVPLVNEFFNLLGIGGGAQTTRNVVSGHIVPAWQQSRTPASPDATGYGPPPTPG